METKIEEVKTIEEQLTELAKNCLKYAIESNEFEYYDILSFGEVAKKLLELDNLKLKPHLITWSINEWEHVANFIYDGLAIIGYDFVGNMDLADDEYKFETDDEIYKRLFRFKSVKCDYTTHLKIGD